MERNPEIVEKFNVRKKRQVLALIPMLFGVLPLMLLGDSAESGLLGIPVNILLPICLTLIIGCSVFSLINMRCPSCNAYLGKRLSPASCSKCGIPLQ